jgi:hypothetical protein
MRVGNGVVERILGDELRLQGTVILNTLLLGVLRCEGPARERDDDDYCQSGLSDAKLLIR